MYWNFGGNFQPVAAVCKYSEWTKCLTSFIEYIWFEIVTDVADCLANEEILWRILAILLIFLTIAYLVYWRLQWTREVERTQEKFKTVNHKIQDIELKVDIITYKTQYGIWPPQYVQEKNASTNVKNDRLGLSKFTLENSWIRNLLARTDKKEYALEKYSNMRRNTQDNCSTVSNIPPPDYDNKLLSDAEKDDAYDYHSKYRNNIEGVSGDLRQSLYNGRFNSLIIPPESNLSDRSKNRILCVKENIGAHESNLSRRKSITLDNFGFGEKKFACKKDLKAIASTTNMKVFSKASLSGFQEKIANAPSKNNHLFTKPHGTLLEVQEKLKTLYATIHHYNTKNPLVPMLELDSDSNVIHTSEAISCTVDKSIEDEPLLEDANKSFKDINKQQIADEHSNCTTIVTSELKSLDDIKSVNNDHVNCNDVEKSFDSSLKCKIQDDKNASIVATDIENSSEYELLPDLFQDIELSLDDSTSALLQEALKFKKQILSNAEMQHNGIDIKEEQSLTCSETNSESSLKQTNMTFDSKILDMITEESSVSSSTEKKGDLHTYKIVEKNKNAQDNTLVLSEKAKRSASKNTVSNNELWTDEKIKKQKEVNCPSKISNKSSTAESSSNRKFPSSFSTIFLCNDQDITNHCKQSHGDATTLETKSSQDCISLTESSSDVSVNRLINKLIENERKSKIPNPLLESEKTTMNDSMQNLTSSDEAKLPHYPIELTNSSIDCDNTDSQQSKKETVIDEETKCEDLINEDTSRIECLRDIKNVAKKLIDSVLEIKNNENGNPSKLKIYGDILSRQSSIPKIKCLNSEIKHVIETSNIDSSTDKCETYSDSSANENSTKWKSSQTEQYDAMQTSKVSNDTSDSNSFNNVQETSTKHNFDCNNWKPSKAKSNLDLTAVDKQFKLNHRRSRSYVNPRGIADKLESCGEKEHSFEPTLTLNKLSVVKDFAKKFQDDIKNEVGMKRKKSSESLCSKSSLNSIQKLILLKDRQFMLTKDGSDSITSIPNKKNYIKNESSLELIPVLSYSSSKSSIPVMKNKLAPRKNEGTCSRESAESSINLSSDSKSQDLICQAGTNKDEICCLPFDKEKSCLDKFTNISELENLKNFEQNAIMYCKLVSEDRLISSYINQKNLQKMTVAELNVPDKVLCSRLDNASSATPEAISRPITCVLSDELSELNPLNSFVFQNTIPSISPYKIERKETEVLVKPSTLDISTSMTNLPCVYHFEEGNRMNDVKIFEISDELTKEECIRYLQMFDQDSNHDQSTNTNDFCNKLLEDI